MERFSNVEATSVGIYHGFVHDFTEQLEELRKVTAGHVSHIAVSIAFGEAGKVCQEAVDGVIAVPGKVKLDWRAS